MNIYLFLGIIFTILAIIALVFFSSYTKLKKHKDRMEKAEIIIDDSLNKKLDLIIKINGNIKKVTGKKDYLKDYVSIRDLIITNDEKDMKLEDAIKLINDLKRDYDKLTNDEDLNNNLIEIKKIDEILTSAKIIFNKNAIQSNQLIKTFPNNIIAKFTNYKFKSYYNTKTDSEETF